MFCLYQLVNGSHTKKIMDVLNHFGSTETQSAFFRIKFGKPLSHMGQHRRKKKEDAENHGRFPSKKITILGFLVLTFQGCKMFMLPVTEDLVKL